MYANDVLDLDLTEISMAVTKPEVVVTFDVFNICLLYTSDAADE